MGIRIEDGSGRFGEAYVEENKLLVKATTTTEFHDIAQNDGESYSWNASYNVTAGDTVLLIKNTGVVPMHIADIYVSNDAATEVIVHTPTTVATPTGTAITGTNMNRTRGNVATAIAKQTETTNVLGTIIYIRGIISANSITRLEFDGSIILGENASVAIDFVTGSTALGTCTVLGSFKAII